MYEDNKNKETKGNKQRATIERHEKMKEIYNNKPRKRRENK